ncbi:MAG: prepilin-type N-terminal cleavage/methylation domain-containing protein [Verrucomicrobiota bacterium]
MISAVRTNKAQRGFTLIEIIMVLGIAAMVMGGAVGLMVFSSDERVLRDASGEIELLAKRARTTAILHQTPYALEFREGTVRLMPLAQAGMDEKKSSRSRTAVISEEDANAAESRQYVLKDGLDLFIRRWNSDTWFGTAKNNVHVWRFDPDGLSEPISVRLTFDKSWWEDTYHPLNATIRESLSETR